ncbi:MAG: hypothetical protein KAJ81_08675 [Candidatus Latescibacteria bacterium]|nr:hypothetical protein [Candidatus Latescibacterota bacterium]
MDGDQKGWVENWVAVSSGLVAPALPGALCTALVPKYTGEISGVPSSIVVTGANRHESQLEFVLDEVIIDRPDNIEQHLCADKGHPCFRKAADAFRNMERVDVAAK